MPRAESAHLMPVGGSATLGPAYMASNAKPDGYTILFGTVGTHAYNQSIYKKRRFSDHAPLIVDYNYTLS